MIIGIEGSYRTDFGWVFPDHKDFMLCNFDAAKAIPTNQIDAVIQTNVLGRLKNKYKAQHCLLFLEGRLFLALLDYYILQKISPFCDNNLSLAFKPVNISQFK